MTTLFHPTDPLFEFETQRILGHAAYGGSDLGEVVAATERITPGDVQSWHAAWSHLADTLADDGDRARSAGHTTSARDAYRRACTYYRAADFFLHGDPTDPRIDHAYRRARDCQLAVVDLSDDIDAVRIPYDGVELHGYLHWPRGPRTDLPVLLLHNGFDGACEEMEFAGALAAVERGWLALSFDGPGQPSALREHGLVFRPDWEHVVTAVLDHLLATHDAHIDTDRIALLGLSLGGYLAPRAAAFEERISAVVAVDGIYDATSTLYDILGVEREELTRLVEEEPDEIERRLAEHPSPNLRWILDQGRYAFGVATSRDFLAAHLHYNLLDGAAGRVRCPALVCSAENDHFFSGSHGRQPEPQRLAAHLGGPTTLLSFGHDHGADNHCHGGAQRHLLARVLDWLDEHLPAPTR